MMLDKALLAAAALLLVLVAEQPAYAYIDPGAGSLIYQTALTVLLGLGFMMRRSRESIGRFFRRLSGRDVASDSGADPRD
jgi:hypothetical protein